MKRVLQAYDAIMRGLVYLAVASLVATTVIVLYDVLSRNLGLPPVKATAALVEYSLMICAMFAAPWLVRIQGHVSLTALTSNLPPRHRWLVNLVGLSISLVAMATLCAVSASLTLENWVSGVQEVRSVTLPSWILYAIMTVGFAFTSTELLRMLTRGEIYSGNGSEH